MLDLSDAEQKLNFADYLLSRDPPFPAAAVKHILRAANVLIMAHFNLAERDIASPQIICRKLADSPETKEFAAQYLALRNISVKPTVLREEAENAYKAVKAFLQMLKRARGPT